MYQVWIYYGVEGWGFDEFKTLDEALDYATKNNYGHDFKITKEVKYEIKVIEKLEE